MPENANKLKDSGGLLWAFLKPIVVVFLALLMLGMLLMMLIQGSMLVDYWKSERVYPASAESIDPALEGRLVRVNGPLVAVDKMLPLVDNEVVTDAVEVQGFGGNRYAEQGLSLGQWQVAGLYFTERYPFGWFHPNSPGVEHLEHHDRHVFVLKSGAIVTLVGRQQGGVLNMADPAARATLGVASERYADHINNRGTDVSLETFEGVALFATVAYVILSLLLGAALRRMRIALIAGAAGILLPGMAMLLYAVLL